MTKPQPDARSEGDVLSNLAGTGREAWWCEPVLETEDVSEPAGDDFREVESLRVG